MHEMEQGRKPGEFEQPGRAGSGPPPARPGWLAAERRAGGSEHQNRAFENVRKRPSHGGATERTAFFSGDRGLAYALHGLG